MELGIPDYAQMVPALNLEMAGIRHIFGKGRYVPFQEIIRAHHGH
jgi:hypothetical protein